MQVQFLSFTLILVFALFQTACKPPPPPEVRMYCGSGSSFEATLISDSEILTSGFSMSSAAETLEGSKNQRFTTDSAINSTNVHELALKYSVVDPLAKIRRGSPAATSTTLYLSTQHRVYAMDRETGCVFWEYRHGDSAIRSASVLLFDNPTTNKRMLVIGTKKAQVIALDANTGEQLWSVYAGNPQFKRYSMITGGLQYHNGRVYVPIASEEVATAVVQPVCCKTHGALRVLDADNGNEVWAYETTAQAERLGKSPFKYGPNGVSVWSTPLIDAKHQQILIGTSQNFTKPATNNSDAIVALDMASGSPLWTFKGTEFDFYNATCGQELSPFKHCEDSYYDYDMITPLLSQSKDGSERIIAADKGGWVYALKPGTGELLWKQKIGAGGLLGGIHWAMAADDEKVYAAVADFAVPKIAILAGKVNADLLNISPGPVKNANPGVYALNLATGQLVWSVNDTHDFEGAAYPSIYSAALSVVNDVVLAASLDGTIKAFDQADGATLWQFNTAIKLTDIHGNKGNGGSIDSVGPIIAGDQILLNSGYSVFNIGGRNEYQAGPGNALMVFELPQAQ
jgi:polyvinyl alcohol dehydrogenase (cytochrome)